MKLAILGYGRMGKSVENIGLNKGHEIHCRINSNHSKVEIQEIIKGADVVIDFSTASFAPDSIMQCFKSGIPVVSGTTGWLDRYHEVISFCKESNGSFLYASNFSIGVNLFFKLNTILAEMMKNYEDYVPKIQEIHHIHKIDAPSGTAISLANEIIRINQMVSKWVNYTTTESGVLPIESIRKDEVPGTHSVTYTSGIDEIKMVHCAKNRMGFASGAIYAAEWLKDKKGVFTMNDIIK